MWRFAIVSCPRRPDPGVPADRAGDHDHAWSAAAARRWRQF